MIVMEKVLITSALPYSYSLPHLGNIVGSVLPADVYNRYMKLSGIESVFICGSDQHGAKIELEALKQKKSAEDIANYIHEKMKKLFIDFGIEFTYYGKTHTEQNKEVVYEFFNALKKNGYIVEKEDMQAYCNFDNVFLFDRFIEGTCPYCGNLHARGDQCDDCNKLLDPIQIIKPHCNICGKESIEFKKVKNLALALNKLEPKIKNFIEQKSKNDWSKNAINKPLSFIETDGLKQRDITRNLKWGFPVPLSGYENYVFYVWFDAVISYIGITKEWTDKWKHYWTDEHIRRVQFMGKDNIEFHTIVFPAIIIGSDLGYKLVDTIRASEFLNSRGVKFSKSRGVGLNIETALDILSRDYWRFVLMYLYPDGSDTEFSIEVLTEVVDSIMNDKIGNLVNRVLTIAKRNAQLIGDKSEFDMPTYKHMISICSNYKYHFEHMDMRGAIKDVVELAELGNALMSSTEPWTLIKKGDSTSTKNFSTVMSTLILIIKNIGILLYPFTPDTSKRILDYFDIEDARIADIELYKRINFNKEIKLIFSKISEDAIAKLNALK